MRRIDRRRAGSARKVAKSVATALALLLAAACGRSLYAPPACSDGVDNDDDGRTDLDDPQCSGPGDDDEGPGGAADADAEVEVESGSDADAGDDADIGPDGEGGPDAGDDGDAPADTGPDGEADTGADGDTGDDGEEADGDAREPCEDGRPCDAMPMGRCVSGACAAIWESTADGDRLGQAVALEGARAPVAPLLSPGLALIGAPEGTAYWGHAAVWEAAGWTEAAAWDGGTALERFGWAVAIGPDLGGSIGLALAVGTMTAAAPAAHGRVAIYGSADPRAPVQELPGLLEGSTFGAAVAWGPDVTGDGVEDLVVGAPTFRPGADTVGAAFLYAGGTWTQVRSWSGTPGSLFGTTVARGPAGGTGRGAMTLVGAPGVDTPASDAGCVYLYEGTADTWSWSQCGEGLLAGFGKALAAGTDVDGDGDGDFAVGSPGWNDRTGKVDLFALSAPWRSWVGSAEGDDFGWAVALGPDADGRAGGELLVGAPGVGGHRGRVLLFRFDEEAPLRVWDGETAGDRFGCAVSLGGDVDGDRRADALIGACGSGFRPGKVYLFGSGSW